MMRVMVLDAPEVVAMVLRNHDADLGRNSQSQQERLASMSRGSLASPQRRFRL